MVTNALSFSTGEHYFPTLQRGDVTIHYSPIFKSIRFIEHEGREYRDQLGSGLHGMGWYFYLIYYSIVLGSCLLVWIQKEIIMDVFIQVTVLNIAAAGMMVFIWALLN